MRVVFILLTLSSLAIMTPALLLPPWTRRKALLAGGAAAAAGAAAFVAYQRSQQPPLFTPVPDSLEHKTIVITGGNTGLGLESAKRLAVGGATVIVTARTDAKGRAAVAAVQDYLAQNKVSNEKVSYQLLNLDDLDSVKEAANWKIDKIDVLLNNAGIMALPTRELTKDGFERQVHTNHLGHFALTAVLSQKLEAAGNPRVVNVASAAYQIASPRGLDFDYMWKPDPSAYGAWKSYGQSKLANILFTQELQRRADQSNKPWTAVAVHPGVVATDLARYIYGVDKFEKLKQGESVSIVNTVVSRALLPFLKTPELGANTQIWLAAVNKEEDVDVKGKYFADCKGQSLPAYATDAVAAKRLWQESESQAGVTFDL